MKKEKLITNKVKNIKDILKIIKPDQDQLILINYTGNNSQLLGAKNFMLAEMIATVLNEGIILDWNDTNQQKWYGWYDYSKQGSGFAASCGTWYPGGAVSSRLHFKSEDLFWFAIKIFPNVYKYLMEK